MHLLSSRLIPTSRSRLNYNDPIQSKSIHRVSKRWIICIDRYKITCWIIGRRHTGVYWLWRLCEISWWLTGEVRCRWWGWYNCMLGSVRGHRRSHSGWHCGCNSLVKASWTMMLVDTWIWCWVTAHLLTEKIDI